MFPLGSSEMTEPARKLIAVVTQVVQRLPNKLSVSGHTDATPFARSGNYGNWELSADRANASRRALLGAGLPPSVSRSGRPRRPRPHGRRSADLPRNRRISMVLLHEAKERRATSPTPKSCNDKPAMTLARRLPSRP